MRIAICAPELESLQMAVSGGPADATAIILAYVAKNLQSHGHNISFITRRSLDEIIYTHDPNTSTLASLTWSASWWFDLTRRGTWRIQQLLGVPYLNYFSNYRLLDACLQSLPGTDLVYERNILYRSGVAMACKRLQLPYVLYFEADDILEYDYMGRQITGLLRWRVRETARYNLNAADCIVCVSEPAKIHLIRNWQIPAEKIVVFPNAADIHKFLPDPQARCEVRASLGIDNRPLIMFVGTFYEWHDVRTLLDAFTQVLKTHPNAYLVLVGDGTQRQVMIQHSLELGVEHAVRFVGMIPHDEVPRFMAAADVGVVPYPPIDRELWLSPLKLFEYMASGTAIVASATGQLTEVIRDGYNGVLVPPGDITVMTAALNKLIDEPALRSRLGQQARVDAVQKYSWDHYISRLELLFAAVVSGHTFDQI